MREVVTMLEDHPYFFDYWLAGDAIVIMRFRHGARRPL